MAELVQARNVRIMLDGVPLDGVSIEVDASCEPLTREQMEAFRTQPLCINPRGEPLTLESVQADLYQVLSCCRPSEIGLISHALGAGKFSGRYSSTCVFGYMAYARNKHYGNLNLGENPMRPMEIWLKRINLGDTPATSEDAAQLDTWIATFCAERGIDLERWRTAIPLPDLPIVQRYDTFRGMLAESSQRHQPDEMSSASVDTWEELREMSIARWTPPSPRDLERAIAAARAASEAILQQVVFNRAMDLNISLPLERALAYAMSPAELEAQALPPVALDAETARAFEPSWRVRRQFPALPSYYETEAIYRAVEAHERRSLDDETVRADLCDVLDHCSTVEVFALRQALRQGRVEGMSPTACLFGTIAQMRGTRYGTLGMGEARMRPVELWFMRHIHIGDRPETTSHAHTLDGWLTAYLERRTADTTHHPGAPLLDASSASPVVPMSPEKHRDGYGTVAWAVRVCLGQGNRRNVPPRAREPIELAALDERRN